MGDDGIAIYVTEMLRKELESRGIEVIIGETDSQYCISKIEEGDFLLILDASYFGIEIKGLAYLFLRFAATCSKCDSTLSASSAR